MTTEQIPRRERALPAGVHHLYCIRPDCREVTSRGRQRYMGANAAGGMSQCVSCGQWYEVGTGGVLSPA